MNTQPDARRGQPTAWPKVKRLVRAFLSLHLPVNSMTKPVWRVLYCVHVAIREGSIWLRRVFWNEPLFRSQCSAVGNGLQMEELPYIQGLGNILLGENVRLSGKTGLAFNNRHLKRPTLKIGDRSFIGHDCSIRVASSIEIGRHCLIAGGAIIADYDGHPVNADQRRANETSPWEDVKPVVIEDDVWIGARSVVLKGVRIGARSIVGAHAVVTKDVPPDCVVAGNPARVVKQLIELNHGADRSSCR